MKRYNIILKLVICFMIIFGIIHLTGCDTIPPIAVENGDCFRAYINLSDEYGVEFVSENTPTVNIQYIKKDKTVKTATFKLDGYDPNKKIGYKLVLEKDKIQWNMEIKDGNQEAPDMNDEVLIQEAALKYEFPVIFIWAYQYQNDFDQDKIFKNREEFGNKFYNLIEKSEIKSWAENGLYDGAWIKEEIEKICATGEGYKINFSHEDLPTICLEYGNNEDAVGSMLEF